VRPRLRKRNLAEVVGFNAQRPGRLGVVIFVSDMRRQLDDLAFREESLQIREEFVRNVDRRRANAVRVFQRDSLPLRQVAGFLNAERRSLSRINKFASLRIDKDARGVVREIDG
jgi:hypothetical protein